MKKILFLALALTQSVFAVFWDDVEGEVQKKKITLVKYLDHLVRGESNVFDTLDKRSEALRTILMLGGRKGFSNQDASREEAEIIINANSFLDDIRDLKDDKLHEEFDGKYHARIEEETKKRGITEEPRTFSDLINLGFKHEELYDFNLFKKCSYIAEGSSSEIKNINYSKLFSHLVAVEKGTQELYATTLPTNLREEDRPFASEVIWYRKKDATTYEKGTKTEREIATQLFTYINQLYLPKHGGKIDPNLIYTPHSEFKNVPEKYKADADVFFGGKILRGKSMTIENVKWLLSKETIRWISGSEHEGLYKKLMGL